MNWDHEYLALTSAMREAGEEALRRARDGFHIFTKPDQSPVTLADHAVNDILQDRLLGQFPDDGGLSEESPDSSGRLNKPRVWVIDPIDGTKAFIRREPEFCISVALIEGTRPILAAIFNPSTGELYTAMRGQGLHLNEAPVPRTEGLSRPQLTGALGQSEMQSGRFKPVSHRILMPRITGAMALAISARMVNSLRGIHTSLICTPMQSIPIITMNPGSSISRPPRFRSLRLSGC